MPFKEVPEEKSKGLVLPGYKYLGPGNELDSGMPVNALDCAAKRHDEKYQKITDKFKETKNRDDFERQIAEADESFIREVIKFAPEKPYDVVAKWLAYGGIEMKHILEKYIGIIYPKVKDSDQSQSACTNDDGIQYNSIDQNFAIEISEENI